MSSTRRGSPSPPNTCSAPGTTSFRPSESHTNGCRTVPTSSRAPLYNWLCCLTADVLGEGSLRYRLWSGLFGIGCAVAALVLATLLFGAEAGLIAGLLIVTNRHFLFIHGIRDGRIGSRARVLRHDGSDRCGSGAPGRWPRHWMVGAGGGSLGGAALMKPPVFAGFFFVVLLAHHLVVRRDLSLRRRLAGPIIAAIVAAAVALPWYGALYSRLGWAALSQVVLSTSVGRAAHSFGESRPWWFYLGWIWDSSLAFKFVAPALAWGLVSALWGSQRFAWGLIVFLSCAFIAAISISATRHWQYVYPIYPVLAVAVSGLLSAGLRPWPQSPSRRWVWLAVAVIGLLAAGWHPAGLSAREADDPVHAAARVPSAPRPQGSRARPRRGQRAACALLFPASRATAKGLPETGLLAERAAVPRVLSPTRRRGAE